MPDMPPSELPTPPDRRPGRRRRTLLGGRVAFGGGAFVFDCAIRDLTEAGASITVPKTQLLPNRVYLIGLRDRLVYEADVAWRKGAEAGLTFLSTMQLSELTDTKLSYLHKLWLERATR